jgi:hypothetical protein
MKTFITFATLIFALNYASFSQQATPQNLRHRLTPEEREQMQANSAQRQTEQMKEFLNLNEDQEKAILEINLKYAYLRTQVTQAARAEGGDIRALLNELDEKREAEILPILNEDQTKLFLEQRVEQQQRRDQMRQRMEERRQRRAVDSVELERRRPGQVQEN